MACLAQVDGSLDCLVGSNGRADWLSVILTACFDWIIYVAMNIRIAQARDQILIVLALPLQMSDVFQFGSAHGGDMIQTGCHLKLKPEASANLTIDC